jgi:hypothetical protein
LISAALLVLTGTLAGPPAGVEVIDISIAASCRHDKVKLTTVKRKDRDILVWRVQSECPTARKVLICVKPAPPLHCSGDPDTAKIGTPFDVGAANGDTVTHYIFCTVKWPAKKQAYEVDVLAGSASDKLICPTIEEDYEIALEVVP